MLKLHYKYKGKEKFKVNTRVLMIRNSRKRWKQRRGKVNFSIIFVLASQYRLLYNLVTRKIYNIYSVFCTFAIISSHLDLVTVICFMSSVIHITYSTFVIDQQLYLLVESVLQPSTTRNTKYRILRLHPLTPCRLQCHPQ